MRIIICTIKSWNIRLAEEFKKNSKHEILIMTSKEELNADSVDIFNPDYIFFPHWSYIIPEEIFEKYECVVFHMADLPYGRGGSPLQNLIVRGHKDTKISALRVCRELDAGPIYMKEDLELAGSAQEIFERTSEIIFSRMIPRIIDERPEPKEQTGEVTVFKRRRPEQSMLTEDMTLEQIYDHIRMLDAEGYPRAYLTLGDHKLCFEQAELKDGKLECKMIIEDIKL